MLTTSYFFLMSSFGHILQHCHVMWKVSFQKVKDYNLIKNVIMMWTLHTQWAFDFDFDFLDRHGAERMVGTFNLTVPSKHGYTFSGWAPPPPGVFTWMHFMVNLNIHSMIFFWGCAFALKTFDQFLKNWFCVTTHRGHILSTWLHTSGLSFQANFLMQMCCIFQYFQYLRYCQ